MIQHVSQALGNDANSGYDDEHCVRSLATAINHIQSGANGGEIHVYDGTFEEPFRPQEPIDLIFHGNVDTFNGPMLKTVDDVSNAVELVGAALQGVRLENVLVTPHSATSIGTAFRAVGVSNLRMESCGVKCPDGSTQMQALHGIVLGHNENYLIRHPRLTRCARGLVIGIEASCGAVYNGHASQCWVDRYNGPYEVYRTRLALSCAAGDAQLAVANVADLSTVPFIGILNTEGVFVQGASGTGQFTNVTRGIVGYAMNAYGPGTYASLTVAPLSQGNRGPTNLATTLPLSGMLNLGVPGVNQEPVTFSSLLAVGDGTFHLNDPSPLQFTHSKGEPIQDASATAGIDHAPGTELVRSYVEGKEPGGSYGGGTLFSVWKGVMEQGRSNPMNFVEEWWGTNHHWIQNDMAEGSGGIVLLRPSSANYEIDRLSIAGGTIVHDSGQGHGYYHPTGQGTLCLDVQSGARPRAVVGYTGLRVVDGNFSAITSGVPLWIP